LGDKNVKKHTKYLLVLLIPFIFGFVFSRYGPWWGLREQASVPETPSDGVKLYVDASNDLQSLHEDGATYKLNLADPNGGLADPTTVGTLSLGSASITDSSGAISFGDEALTTTGDTTVNDLYITTNLYHKDDTNTAFVFGTDRITMYAGTRVMMDAIETTQDILYLGYEAGRDIDVVIGSGQAISVEGSSSNITLNGALIPVNLADANAPNNSIYYSTTQSKLVYKDSGGSVNDLY
jgi:hypothetical protein